MVVDIAPIVEEKITKKKEEEKTKKQRARMKKMNISKRFQHPMDASINSRNRMDFSKSAR